jgi:hypothetical protein
MRNVTHQFAHVETLERARRWLIQAGVDPGRIEAHTKGTPRIAVAVEPGEAAEVQRIIDAAESSDPEGNPGFWDVAPLKHDVPHTDQKAGISVVASATRSESFVVGWRPQDVELEVTQTHTDIELQKDYREGKD